MTGWVFNAFRRILYPEVVICLDAGTRSGPKSLLRLWKEFYNDKTSVGVVGRLTRCLTERAVFSSRLPQPRTSNIRSATSWTSLWNRPSVTSQSFLVPTPLIAFELSMGSPWKSILSVIQPCLRTKRKPEPSGMGAFMRNMALGDDRILSFDIVIKVGSRWRTKYVRAAKADTDIPEGIVEFITQRRR